MKIATAGTIQIDTKLAIEEVYAKVSHELGTKPKLFILTCTVKHDIECALETLKSLCPDTPIQGGTSYQGVMTEHGFYSAEGFALSLFAITDENAAFGVASEVIGENPRQTGKNVIEKAIKNADRVGEAPTAIWMIAAPGSEEEIITGIEDVVGTSIPLIGGTSADNSVEGYWKQFTNEGIESNSVCLVAFYLSTRVATAFHSGYDPSFHQGKVTKAEGRKIVEIDGKPAVETYNDWTQGALKDYLKSEGSIFTLTNLFPLGRKVGDINGVPYFVLSHPGEVVKGGQLALFTGIKTDDVLYSMNGSVENLVKRAGNVAKAALRVESLEASDIAGALIIFCAGCMITVGDRIEEACENIRNSLKGIPVMTMFTFGEQGSLAGGENRHGNLMISILLFSKK